jgi:pyridoxamine 5'-phosphate oxidase
LIAFNNHINEAPYLILKEKYDESLTAGQKNIEAISVSSYSTQTNEVNSRFVNLKFINGREFIFFTNYNSPKAEEFDSHNQVAVLIFWESINLQIRMKGYIKKTKLDFNNKYFQQRDAKKNALAISSTQSMPVKSYNEVKENYYNSLKTANLNKCPHYWGGYSFCPYYFEFWEGHQSRLNKRNVYQIDHDMWQHKIIQP